MGRSAKYFTSEERRTARREQYRLRSSAPEMVSARSEINRRYYQKKRGLQLLQHPLFVLDPSIRRQAVEPISSPDYYRLFIQFCEGRDSLGLEDCDVEEEDLRALTGLPPYPEAISSLSTSTYDWQKLIAAVHGFATRKYLESLDQSIVLSARSEDHQFIFKLIQENKRLTTMYRRLERTHGLLIQEDQPTEIALVRYNKRWISRLLEYNREDIEALKQGKGFYIRGATDRKWNMGHLAEAR